MNSRAFTLALVISVFAMFMVHTYISDQESGIVKQYGTMATVVVAKVDIKELELIDDSKIMVKSMPADFLSPGHFKTMKEIENTVATVPILKGEQITKPRVTYPSSKTGLSRQIAMGKRAIAIQVKAAAAASLLIKPGDRVDVVAKINYASGRVDLMKVKTVLQDVLVLSTGWNMTNSIPMVGVKTPTVIREMKLNVYSRYRTVTLEVDPFQAQRLSYIVKFQDAKPTLLLRNNNDKERVRIPSIKIFDLVGEDKAEAKAYFKEKYDKQKSLAPKRRR